MEDVEKKKKKKCVTFTQTPDEIYYMEEYIEDQREARNGTCWFMDAQRFKRRIAEVGLVLEPYLLGIKK